MRKVASILYLLTGLVIGLGAFGHDSNTRHLAEQFARFPALDADLVRIVYAVWHFCSGCMLVFGAIIVWTWLRARRGARGVFFASDAIGVFYLVAGAGCVIYTGRPFFWLFTILGLLLLATAAVLRAYPGLRTAPSDRAAAGS
jgi:hypothetical protein